MKKLTITAALIAGIAFASISTNAQSIDPLSGANFEFPEGSILVWPSQPGAPQDPNFLPPSGTFSVPDGYDAMASIQLACPAAAATAVYACESAIPEIFTTCLAGKDVRFHHGFIHNNGQIYNCGAQWPPCQWKNPEQLE